MSTVLTHRVALAIGCVALLALTSVCTGTDSIPPFKPGFAVSPAGGTATGLFDETTTRDFGRKMLTGGEPSARKKKELRRVEKVEKGIPKMQNNGGYKVVSLHYKPPSAKP